jgi:hypothetical protein
LRAIELSPFATVPYRKNTERGYRDGDVHGRQEQGAVEEGKPEVADDNPK